MSSFAVHHATCSNGMNVLVVPRHHVPKVSLQLLYHVGSKNEICGQRGIAHFIEHMIFKGTHTLSETDITTLVYKLSGSCNAFTSHDYTGYSFDVPSHQWREIVPIMADCMENCTFKRHHMNSELKAIIQEMKMYNDDYPSTLIETMMSSMLSPHPYQYPIIGYKDTIAQCSQDDLISFYQTYYVPNNATLVVVGDVDPDEVTSHVEKVFGSIPGRALPHRVPTTSVGDVGHHEVTLYRDIQQPFLFYAWRIPGMSHQQSYVWDVLSWVLANGRGSRLYRLLVHQHDLVTQIQSFVYDCFDHSIFFIYVQPHSWDDEPRIRSCINEVITEFQQEGVPRDEIERGQRKTHMDFVDLQEDMHKQAYLLGKLFLATGDAQILGRYADHEIDHVAGELKRLCQDYLPSFAMCSGYARCASEAEHKALVALQSYEDKKDEELVASLERSETVEPVSHAQHIRPKEPAPFSYERPEVFVLSNGLRVMVHDRPGTGKVECICDIKAKHFYDAEYQQGLHVMMTDTLQEGTHAYSAQGLARELEAYGMELTTLPGQFSISMLSDNITEGMRLFSEVLLRPTFPQEGVERVRRQVLAELESYWDKPSQYAVQLLREAVYQDHPLAHNMLGKMSYVEQCPREDIIAAYARYMVPDGARLSLVGDFQGTNVRDLVERYFGAWHGTALEAPSQEGLVRGEGQTVIHTAQRDQTVMAYGALSVPRGHEDYDPLLIFDQIFTGGVLGGMNSRLFMLREQTGLFYAIGGSLLAGSGRYPGMIYIKALTSPELASEADAMIRDVCANAAVSLTDEEVEDAQRALINSMPDNFETNRQLAATFLHMDKHQLPRDYFERRPDQLRSVTKEQIQRVVARYLDPQKLTYVRVGRSEKEG